MKKGQFRFDAHLTGWLGSLFIIMLSVASLTSEIGLYKIFPVWVAIGGIAFGLYGMVLNLYFIGVRGEKRDEDKRR